VLVCAIAPEQAHALVATVHKHFPDLKLMVRSRNRFDAYDLMDLGVLHLYRDSLHTSVQMGVDVLRELGFRAYTAHRAGQDFLRYDQAALKELAARRHDKGAYIAGVREKVAEQEALLRRDLAHDPTQGDHAWDSEEMRDALAKPRS
jgi:CPA2 family monovalent cation:H+ antiporter-2